MIDPREINEARAEMRELIHKTMAELESLVMRKNHDYGNAAAKSPYLVPGSTPFNAIMTRKSDKIERERSMMSGCVDTVGEPLEKTLMDDAGYSILAVIELRRMAKKRAEKECEDTDKEMECPL